MGGNIELCCPHLLSAGTAELKQSLADSAAATFIRYMKIRKFQILFVAAKQPGLHRSKSNNLPAGKDSRHHPFPVQTIVQGLDNAPFLPFIPLLDKVIRLIG